MARYHRRDRKVCRSGACWSLASPVVLSRRGDRDEADKAEDDWVDWQAYFAGLGAQDRVRAGSLVTRFGEEAAERRVRYHPVSSLDDLENELGRDSRRVRTQVAGLYESIDANMTPPGWTIINDLQEEHDGTLLARTRVTGPNGASGFFERGYNPRANRLEMRNAFLRLRGMTAELPSWVEGAGIPMVVTRGTPTVQYFTLYQFKLLGVPAGKTLWWRRALYRLGLRAGPFAAPGLVSQIKMSTIQNVEAILHLHWLRERYPQSDLSNLIVHTDSVKYAETTAIQCGYRLTDTRYIAAGEWENEIGDLLAHFEKANPQRKADNDKLLARFSFSRQTIMKQNFDIELSLAPESVQ